MPSREEKQRRKDIQNRLAEENKSQKLLALPMP
jgi:hypothetical protein